MYSNDLKYIKSSLRNFEPTGYCDASSFMVAKSRLVKQMAYSGRGLVWTGNWVYKDFADKPNAQGLVPKFYGDPKPVVNARPFPGMPPVIPVPAPPQMSSYY